MLSHRHYVLHVRLTAYILPTEHVCEAAIQFSRIFNLCRDSVYVNGGSDAELSPSPIALEHRRPEAW